MMFPKSGLLPALGSRLFYAWDAISFTTMAAGPVSIHFVCGETRRPRWQLLRNACFSRPRCHGRHCWKWNAWNSRGDVCHWGPCALHHTIQNSMAAILACHPDRSTEWLGWVANFVWTMTYAHRPHLSHYSKYGVKTVTMLQGLFLVCLKSLCDVACAVQIARVGGWSRQDGHDDGPPTAILGHPTTNPADAKYAGSARQPADLTADITASLSAAHSACPSISAAGDVVCSAAPTTSHPTAHSATPTASVSHLTGTTGAAPTSCRAPPPSERCDA